MRVAIVVSFLMLANAVIIAADPGGRVEVVDGTGRMMSIPAHPARIVSLAPSVTEMLFAVGAGGQVVGVTDFCDYPPEAAARPRVGGLINPDLEKILSLKPDLVIASTAGNYRDDTERIERLGPPVYAIDTPTLGAIIGSIETVGELVGAAARARELGAGLRGRIEKVRSDAAGRARLRALFVIEPAPLVVPGPATFIGEALAVAGVDLVPGTASGWSQIDMEQVVGIRPQMILTTEANRSWADRLASQPEWLPVPAVSGGRVFVVSDSIQHPGPRLVDGIEEIARLAAGL